MKEKIQNSAALTFIGSVIVLTAVSILGIWDVFSDDVIEKSFLTLGLLAVVAIILMIAGRFIGDDVDETPMAPPMPNPIFRSTRRVTLGVLILSAVFLALLGVMAIWEVVDNTGEIVSRTLSSLGILTFTSFIVVMTALYQEGKLSHKGTSFSLGRVILALVLAFLLIPVIFGVFLGIFF